MNNLATENTYTYSSRSLPPLPPEWLSLGHAFLHQARLQPDAIAIYDSIGVDLTYRETLERAIALAGILRHRLGGCKYVGILLPPSAAAVVTNLALTFLDKIVVNLNYTASQATFDYCVERCGITHVIVAERVMKKVRLVPSCAKFISIESLKHEASPLVKAYAWCEAHIVPDYLLGLSLPGLSEHFSGAEHEHLHHIADNMRRRKIEEVAAVVFTTGSTSQPKGVMLTHKNILSNIWALQNFAKISSRQVILGVVPFFHSFGFTLTLWAVLALGHTAVYHYNPLESKLVGALCGTYKASVLFCTPTIMKGYLNRCKPENFKTIKFCILGGEKLNHQLEAQIQDLLGIVPMQGYGLTETSPVVACNIPWDFVLENGVMVHGYRSGTVGLPFPGTKIKIADLATGQSQPPAVEGLIMVQGPQVMEGYLNDPERTENVLKDGWFATGDLGFVDQDGFLTVTGRLSQFAKIAGEMVPHLAVEEELLRIVQQPEQTLAVTSIPDKERGERLLVVHTGMELTPEAVVKQLKETNISRLWIPAARDFIRVVALPMLPTGKLDLRAIRKIAEDNAIDQAASPVLIV